MRTLAVLVLLAGGCTFEPGAVTDDGSSIGDGGDDAQVPDGALDDSHAPPDLHRVPDGVAPGQPGWPCAAAEECDNGFCIDGYCCESDCDREADANTCKACNVPGQEGRCVFALDNTDPRQQCEQDAPSSCGKDGLCDGKGGCRLWNAGLPCGATTCSTGVVTYMPACDGLGNCLPGGVSSCYPYACLDATQCATTCGAAMMTCATGVPCTMGTCGKRADGQPCSVQADCQSDHCEQGVCCASACSGTCFSCNLAGKVGTCAPVASGLDPLNQCTSTTRASCGDDGTCDGSGACRKWVSGTPCAGRACLGDSVADVRKCDGAGTCAPPAMIQSCDPYTCNPGNGSCYKKCAADGQCAAGKTCQNKKCQ